MKTRKSFFLILAILPLFFLIITTSNSSVAKDGEEMPISITVQASWSGCDGNCDNKQSGNHINSGSYTINISGTMVTKRGKKDYVTYEPKSLTGTFSVQSTALDISNKECQKCNPWETISANQSIAFGKDPNTIAFIQAFTGIAGTGLALQLMGKIEGYEKTLPSMKERRIISFNATVPVTMTRTSVDSCKTCSKSSETLNGGFGVAINVDMTSRKTGSVSWKAKDHPLSTMGVGVIDLGDYIVPKNDPQGKAQYNVTWSLGEAKPAKLKLKEVHFNYDSNKDSGVSLINFANEKEIKTPEWTAAGEKKPAAFIRNKPFKVKAIFGIEGNRIERAEIWAEEEIDEKQDKTKKGFEGLKRTMVEFAEGETEKEVEFTIESPQAAISVNNVRWCWRADIWYKDSQEAQTDIEIKTDGPQEAKGSEHTIYIVGEKPVPLTTAYEFAVKKGCQWAEGKQGGDDAFQAIWKSFRNIECPEGSSCPSGVLSYEHGDSPATTSGLLRAGRGKCGAWQDFFTDVVGSQGIEIEQLTIKPKRNTGLNTMIVWARPAQGNNQPKRLFYDHAIIKYQGRFYDPSYHFDLPVSAGEAISLYENETFIAYCTDKESVNNVRCIEKCVNTATGDPDYDCLARECDCRKNYPLECEVTTE